MQYKKVYFFLSLFLLVLFISCNKKAKKYFLKIDEVQHLSRLDASITGAYKSSRAQCFDALSYAPDLNYINHSPIRYVRVNFHFMDATRKKYNYQGQNAKDFVRKLLDGCNSNLKKNKKMKLPKDNTTPVLPPLYQYVLTPDGNDPSDDGIYFHYDDESYYVVSRGKARNVAKKDAINKYAVNKDSVLNIFIMPHHPDSARSKTYLIAGKVPQAGIAMGHCIKVFGPSEKKDKSPWFFRGLVNHEVGHVFSLAHAWSGDGCDDTPRHKNTWKGSNNMMDYNDSQGAMTPCQIGKVRSKMNRIDAKQRNLIIPTWCSLKEDQTITITDKVHWMGEKDIEGHLIIEPKGELRISCRVSLPKDAYIVVRPGGKLILENALLHNACGDKWKGIEIHESGNQKGEVVFVGDAKIDNVQHPID